MTIAQAVIQGIKGKGLLAPGHVIAIEINEFDKAAEIFAVCRCEWVMSEYISLPAPPMDLEQLAARIFDAHQSAPHAEGA